MSFADEIRKKTIDTRRFLKEKAAQEALDEAHKAKQHALESKQKVEERKIWVEQRIQSRYEAVKQLLVGAASHGRGLLEFTSPWDLNQVSHDNATIYKGLAHRLREDGFIVTERGETRSEHRGSPDLVREERLVLDIEWEPNG